MELGVKGRNKSAVVVLCDSAKCVFWAIVSPSVTVSQPNILQIATSAVYYIADKSSHPLIKKNPQTVSKKNGPNAFIIVAAWPAMSLELLAKVGNIKQSCTKRYNVNVKD